MVKCPLCKSEKLNDDNSIMNEELLKAWIYYRCKKCDYRFVKEFKLVEDKEE